MHLLQLVLVFSGYVPRSGIATYIFLKYVCFYDYGDDNTHYKKH